MVFNFDLFNFELRGVLVVTGLATAMHLSLTACAPKNDSSEKVNNTVRCDGEGEVGSYGIIGGRTLSAESHLAKGVVYIVSSFYKKGSRTPAVEQSCTGSLLDSNIVLTAAHCFETPKLEDYNPADLSLTATVYAGYRPFCQKEENINGIAVSSMVVHDSYGKFKVENGDIALIKLSQMMPGEHTYYAIDQGTYSFGQMDQLIAVGYGQTKGYQKEESNDRPLKFGFLSTNHDQNFRNSILDYYKKKVDIVYDKLVDEEVKKAREKALKDKVDYDEAAEKSTKQQFREEVRKYVESITPKFDYNTSIETLVFNQSKSDGAVCSGDSGGPGLRKVDGSLRIVGVTQAVFSTNSFVDPCRYAGFYTNVSYYKEWIIKKFNSLIDSNTKVHRSGDELFQR